jgi:Na+/H+ antiporter NhaD/arsenite permease-like protein
VWLVAAIAGALVVATTALPGHDAVSTTQTAAPVLMFLVAVTVLAGLSDTAGLFELLSRRTARLSGGSTTRLFLLVCALATLVTVGLSLDTTAVLLTPVVLALAAAVDVDPLPFAYATVLLANSASLLLPVSNLTNLLATNRLGSLGAGGFARRTHHRTGRSSSSRARAASPSRRRRCSGWRRGRPPFRQPRCWRSASRCAVRRRSGRGSSPGGSSC